MKHLCLHCFKSAEHEDYFRNKTHKPICPNCLHEGGTFSNDPN